MINKTNKLGRYLLDNKVCDENAIEEALKKQSALEEKGEHVTMGQILVDNGAVAPEDLEKGLSEQWIDLLAAADLFKSLTEEQVRQVAWVAEDRTVPEGTILFSQGDPGDTYWLVIYGEVRVYRSTDEGTEVDLAFLKTDDGFGEMSLLTGEPRSASVETAKDSRFLVIHKNDFDQVVSHSPELTIAYAKILADRLTRGNVNLGRASEKERAYQRFVSDYQVGPQFELIGKSRRIEQLRDQAREFAADNKPVLLYGPPGTEKKAVSWYIHNQVGSPEDPFLLVDIKNVRLNRQSKTQGSSDPLQAELAQDSTLFGHLQSALSFAKSNRLGLLQVGDGGTVVIDNIESLSLSMQTKLADFIRNGYFLPLGKGDKVYSAVRVICSTTVDLKVLVDNDSFSDELYGLLAGQSLTVPPLRRRKKDLRLLTDYLIDHFSRQLGKTITGVDKRAYGEIMAYDWPGNMDELEVVIRRAVNLTSHEKLVPENLFIGTTPTVGKFTFNLLQLPKFKVFFTSTWFPKGLQIVSGVLFLYIFYLGFWGSQNPEDNMALVLTWGIWEPLGVVSTIVFARLWCGICPIGAVSSLCSKYAGLKLSVPHFFRKYGFYLSGLGLALIIWSEIATHMTASPRATAFLLTAIAVPAIIFGLLFQRRAWCRYICPLGKMVGVFAGASIVELRANYGICNNDCQTHKCYTGDEGSEDGCPMFEGPFSLRSNLNCTLCGNCIKNCPNQSPQVNLRLPGYELWATRRFEKPVAFMVPLIIGTQIFRGLYEAGYLHYFLKSSVNQPVTLFALLAAVTGLVFLAVTAAEKLMLLDMADSNENYAGMLAYSLLPLAATFEIAFHMERLLLLGGEILPVLGRQFNLNWEAYGTSGAIWAITTLQIMLVIIGGLATAAIIRRRYRAAFDQPPAKFPVNWRLPSLLTTICFIWLFIVG